MFSTFTGNSRRPRNVNLSGQAGNPFANTSWSPSVASNATKTVTDAQAEREKRQTERQRQKAAAKIQRTWRGHKARDEVADSRRIAFDELYQSSSDADAQRRMSTALTLLLSFCRPQRRDDISRLFLLVNDCRKDNLNGVYAGSHPSRLRRLVELLVKVLGTIALDCDREGPRLLLDVITRIVKHDSTTITTSFNNYFSALASICSDRGSKGGKQSFLLDYVAQSLAVVLQSGQSLAYDSFAFRFLTSKDIDLFEENISSFASFISSAELAKAILQGYGPSTGSSSTKDELLWLLAHFIDLGQNSLGSSQDFLYLNTLFTQLCALSSEISLRVRTKMISDSSNDSPEESSSTSFEPYVGRQLLSLVAPEGISQLIRDFSNSLKESSSQEFGGTSLLAGYNLALLQAFPSSADDVRMRLFLEQIPTDTGDVPLVIFLWQMMRQTTVFAKLKTEAENPVNVLRHYLQTSSHPSNSTTEEQEWRVILLFLDLYIFILRLSDDEDFFSGMQPTLQREHQPASRIRACSLSQDDLKLLMLFLKNTAFALHYNAQEISRGPFALDSSVHSRLDSYLGSFDVASGKLPSPSHLDKAASTKWDIDSLRTIITTALKMLYERNSRKQFLSAEAWLMTYKLEQEDFVSAVIAEEERQIQEQEAEDSDEDVENPSGGLLAVEGGFYSTIAGQRLSRHARLERLKAQQIRAQKERRQAELGPKLEVLKHMPFVVPFETRVMIFRQFVHLDRVRRDGDSPFFIHPNSRHQARIRRGNLFEDAYKQFYAIGDGLKDQIQITFMDQFGSPEAGIDGGGVTKEFLTSITTEAFGAQDGSGMFTSNEKGLLFPNPAAVDMLRESMRRRGLTESDEEWRVEMHELLRRYEFLGRIVGKCMYEGILVDLAFAGFFLLKWPSASVGEENRYKGSVNDLKDMDEELYNGMLRLKNYPGDVSELGLDFTITDQISAPGEPTKTTTRNLVQYGDQVPVTNDNRLLYISYVARHRLVVQPSLQTNAFLRGLRAIIRPTWLSMFNQSELQRLVGGDSTPIDIEDLRRNTIYSGLYEIGDDNQEHPTIKLFWKVLEGFTDAQRRDVLKYVSSTPRAPLLGFSQLRPKFSIRDGGADEDRLPSTSTCVNLLKLPLYRSESTLREKLLYAITSGAGFDLS
ncbi:putative E3 ubiquitin protein ligase [Paramyrothecium foliicola]|nr:putative E3 ubiquitin protein ligase [Paramyrothecium foliicola]